MATNGRASRQRSAGHDRITPGKLSTALWTPLPPDTGVELDLTYEQFQRGQVVAGARVVKRPAGPLPRRGAEYTLLRDRVAARLGGGPLPAPQTRVQTTTPRATPPKATPGED
ncbi:MAG: YunG family protein [Actinoallomurus sp.]